MEENMKIVSFDIYCKSCKHKSKEDYEDPCNECLHEPARQYSHKPLNYEEDKK